MESVSERRDQPSKSFDTDRQNKIKTEICPLDLTVWRSLVIFISVVLVTQWEEDLSGVGSREKGHSLET